MPEAVAEVAVEVAAVLVVEDLAVAAVVSAAVAVHMAQFVNQAVSVAHQAGPVAMAAQQVVPPAPAVHQQDRVIMARAARAAKITARL